MFVKDTDYYFTGAYIKIGFFETDAEIIYQDEIHGPLTYQVDTAIQIIYLKYLKAKISYRGIQRIERYPFPEDALREAILNAVIHKLCQAIHKRCIIAFAILSRYASRGIEMRFSRKKPMISSYVQHIFDIPLEYGKYKIGLRRWQLIVIYIVELHNQASYFRFR
jgi:hypothetical protein